MQTASELSQQLFYKFFQEISMIPRGSGNESAISSYILSFAQKRGLFATRDQALNVIVKKEASKGCTVSAPVILQGHLDMVCEKEADSPHDFMVDPIIPIERDGFLVASGTTLGADNGIGAAYILAVLADDTLMHPPIEAVFTSNEEVGMEGMSNLDVAVLTGTQMINLDNEEEGSLAASCAGGNRFYMKLPIARQPGGENFKPFTIMISGLAGGHSGVDIDQGRGNSIMLLARLLDQLKQQYVFGLSRLNGGTKPNAIPREASATLWVLPQDTEGVQCSIEAFQQVLQREYGSKEPGLEIGMEPTEIPVEDVLSEASVEALLGAILLIPNGVISFSSYLSGVVESSSNLGIIDLQKDNALLTGLARSNSDTKMEDILSRLNYLARLFKAGFELGNGYPAWEYNENSALRTSCMELYQKLYGTALDISSMHGGLECALMLTKRKDMDMVSIGPNLYDVHTTRERAGIGSMIRTWEYLVYILQHMAA